MAIGLSGRKVAILATDGVEQVELVEPRTALEAAGAETHLVSPKKGEIQGFRHHEKGERFKVDRALADAMSSDYAALVLPGGVANLDALRTDPAAVQFLREFMVSDKPVAAICHGPRLLVDADAVKGRTLTSWPSLKADIIDAGGEWVDEPVHVDDKLITSRKPDDLPLFNRRMVQEFGSWIDERAMDELSEQSFPASDAPPGPMSIGGMGGSRTPAPGREGEARP